MNHTVLVGVYVDNLPGQSPFEPFQKHCAISDTRFLGPAFDLGLAAVWSSIPEQTLRLGDWNPELDA
jgi:hypothetical protein